jgi:hypothetical protein
VTSYIKWVESKLGIQDFKDWYRVTVIQLRRLGGGSVVLYQGGLVSLLRLVYPNHEWDVEALKVKRLGHKTQEHLSQVLQQIFPDVPFTSNFRHSQIRLDGNRQLELDIYYPSLSLAFEYQGRQHFEQTPVHMDTALVHSADQAKQQQCRKLGITLISIPYWWNGSESSLRATVHAHRPDLVPKPPNNVQPISEIQPETSLTASTCKCLSHFFLVLIHLTIAKPGKNIAISVPYQWNASVDPAGWYASNRFRIMNVAKFHC